MQAIVGPATASSIGFPSPSWRLQAPAQPTIGLLPTDTADQSLLYVIQMAVTMERTIERPRPVGEDGSNRYFLWESGNQVIDRLCRGNNFSEDPRLGSSAEGRQ